MSHENLSDTVELLALDTNGTVHYSSDPGSDLSKPQDRTVPFSPEVPRREGCNPVVYTYVAASLAAIGGILFGYDVGIISGALLQLTTKFCLTCLQKEMVVGLMLIGAIIGSLTGGFLIDYYGRRFTIIVNSFIFVLGAMVLALSPSYTFIIVGRLIVGYAVSLSAIAECVYVSEIAPAKIRGLLVSLNELGITLGFLLAYLVSYFFIDATDGWRYMFALSAIPAVIQGVGMFFLPKSPRYLMIKKKEQQALEVLNKLRRGSPSSIQTELTGMRISLTTEQDHKFCDLFTSKDNMRGRLVIGAGLVFFQQFTGQPNVLYYAPTIFESVGFESHTGATLATVGLGLVKVLCTIIAVIFVDRTGRRKLLIGGATLMALSILLLGLVSAGVMDARKACDDQPCLVSPLTNHTPSAQHTSFNSTMRVAINGSSTYITSTEPTTTTVAAGKYTHISSARKWTSMAALMLFVAAFAVGFGPVTWLVLSEIFPSSIKGRAISIATIFNWGTNLLVSLTFLDVMNVLGVSWTFISYSFICVISVIFIFSVVPETKQKSLEQISNDLKKRSPLQRMIAHCQTLPCCNKKSAFRLRMSGMYRNVEVT